MPDYPVAYRQNGSRGFQTGAEIGAFSGFALPAIPDALSGLADVAAPSLKLVSEPLVEQTLSQVRKSAIWAMETEMRMSRIAGSGLATDTLATARFGMTAAAAGFMFDAVVLWGFWRLYSDAWAELGDGPIGIGGGEGEFGPFPDGIIANCTGLGVLQGATIRGGACGEFPSFLLGTYHGWDQVPGGEWTWTNLAGRDYIPGEDFAPTVQKVGEWYMPLGSPKPGVDPSVQPAPRRGTPGAPDPELPDIQYGNFNDPAGHPPPHALQPKRKWNRYRDPLEQTRRGPDGRNNDPPKDRGSSGVPDADFNEPHVRAPPGAGVKERKVKVTGALRIAMVTGYALTEMNDAIQSVYKGLPSKLRYQLRQDYGRKLRPQEKAWEVYHHISELDVGVALYQLIEDQAQDFVLGRYYRRTTPPAFAGGEGDRQPVRTGPWLSHNNPHSVWGN